MVQELEIPSHTSRIIPVQKSSHDELGQEVLTTAKNGSISFLGRIFEYAVRFIFGIVIARSLGAEQYGLYILSLSLVPIATMLALLGLQTGLIRFLPPAIRQREDGSIWGLIQIGAGLSGLLAILLGWMLFIGADVLAVQVFHDARLSILFRMVAICIPLDALSFIALTVMQGFKDLRYITLVNYIIIPFFKLLLTVGFLAVGLGLYGVVTAHVLMQAAGLLLLIYSIHTIFPLNRPLRSAKYNLRQVLRYSLPSYPGWVIKTVSGLFETMVLGILGLTTGVGVYNAALRFSIIGNLFFSSIAAIAAPIIADFYSRHEIHQLKSFYCTTTRWLLIFSIPFFFTCTIFAAPMLSIFGPEFAAGSLSLIILAFGALVYSGTGISATILDFTEHQKVNSINSAFSIAITLGLDILLIPPLGLIGAALAASLSTIVINLISMTEVIFLVRIVPYDKSIFKPVIAGLAAASVTLLINYFLPGQPMLQLSIGLMILWSVYVITLFAVKLSPEEQLVFDRVALLVKTQVRHAKYRFL
jgi:O-antigen/teichoic acid export membrane protein